MLRLRKAIHQTLLSREVDAPTYERDVVGDIERWDERDIVFARKDLFRYLGEDSPEHKAYYEAHPEYLKYDTKIGNMPGLGKTGAPADVPMFETQFAMISRIGLESFVDGKPASGKVEVPPERAAQKVKELARLLGADLVKIGPLRQEWAYTHVGRGANRDGFLRLGTPIDLSRHPNAIAMAFQMDYELSRTGPDFPTLLATAKGYAMGAWVSVQLAEYIRMLGYSARAHHLNNYQVLVIPVAVDCGLGELSRAGYLITREFGLAVRLAVVTTDMPLAHDKPVDIGVQSFCETCKLCAEECPSRAIPTGDKVEYNGIKKWKLDEEACYRYWHVAGTDCSICMMVCPWTKPDNWFHKMMSVPATIAGPHQALMTWADKLFYGKYRSAPGPDFIDSYKRYGPRR